MRCRFRKYVEEILSYMLTKRKREYMYVCKNAETFWLHVYSLGAEGVLQTSLSVIIQTSLLKNRLPVRVSEAIA
jgi:hypothetical protein